MAYTCSDVQNPACRSADLPDTKLNIMKNKGRRHKAAHNESMSGILDCKGYLTHITRPIEQMGKGAAWVRGKSKKWLKEAWNKRVRGYFKSQTKQLIF